MIIYFYRDIKFVISLYKILVISPTPNSLLHPATKHLNILIGDILSSPAPEAESFQFTQGGSEVRRSCQSTIVGAACTELRHSDRSLRTA